VIFRAELVLLLAPLALVFLLNRQISFPQLLYAGFPVAFAALGVTVAVDSFFWGRLLYPEGQVLWFNTILNKSGEYGTSPWHWYFTSALPRAMTIALPLSLLSVYTVPRARALVAIPTLFIAVYSMLPHKELRFVLYAIPPLNVAAGAALAKLYRALPSPSSELPTLRTLGLVGRLAILAALAVAVAASTAFAAAAYHNYPGAAALAHVHKLGESRGGAAARRKPMAVHIGVDAAMSGVSRFLERPAPWRYSKVEDLAPQDYRQFAYVLAGPMAELPGFTHVHTVSGFNRVMLRPPFFEFAPRVRVLQRRKEHDGTGGGGAVVRDDFAEL